MVGQSKSMPEYVSGYASAQEMFVYINFVNIIV